ncbi:hypothetical protein MRY87_01415, partial [bacterium]|nr:hypothetical protein [bacterium]
PPSPGTRHLLVGTGYQPRCERCNFFRVILASYKFFSEKLVNVRTDLPVFSDERWSPNFSGDNEESGISWRTMVGANGGIAGRSKEKK